MYTLLLLAWLLPSRAECATEFACDSNATSMPMSFIESGTQESSDDELASGLRARYRPGSGKPGLVRIDRDLQFQWEDASPDPRIAAGPFEVRWTGKLFVAANAKYRFHLFAAGSARMSIDAKLAIEGTANDATWLSSAEIPLELGHHAIEITYTSTSDQARIG